MRVDAFPDRVGVGWLCMRWISGARRMLTLQWAGPAALGSCRWRRAGVRAGVVVVALIAVVVGVALKVVDPSRAGAAGPAVERLPSQPGL